MKRVQLIILNLILLGSFYACKKDKKTSSPETTATTAVSEPNYINYDGTIGNNNHSSILTSDNAIITCGVKDNKSYYFKTSKTGTLLWAKNFTTSYFYPFTFAVAEGANNQLFICGSALSNKTVLLKADLQTGDTLWTKAFNFPNSPIARCILKTSDNNLLIGGYANTTGIIPKRDVGLIKLDMNGDTLWTRVYPGVDEEAAAQLLQLSDGGYLVAINDIVEHTNKFMLLKVNSNGTLMWYKKIQFQYLSECNSVIELADGSIIACGMHNFQIALIKMDSQGNLIWTKEYGDLYWEESNPIMNKNTDGTVSITGWASDAMTNTQTQLFFLKVDANGNQLKWKTFGNDTAFRIPANILKDNNNNHIITGSTQSYESIFMFRMDNDGGV